MAKSISRVNTRPGAEIKVYSSSNSRAVSSSTRPSRVASLVSGLTVRSLYRRQLSSAAGPLRRRMTLIFSSRTGIEKGLVT